MTTLPAARGYASTVATLTFANTVAVVAGLITGPIVARALGVEGRGELAAIIAVFTLSPLVLDLGLPSWLARERARGATRDELIGAALPLALLGSLAGMAAAWPVAQVVGDGRPVVETLVLVWLLLSPLAVLPATLIGLAIGESRWGLVSATRITASVLPLLAIVMLAVIGGLTVASAAGAYLVGSLVGGFLLLALVRGVRKLVLSRRRMREALRFGALSWLIAIAVGANYRLDQVLMAVLVSSRELGLYAVAVTITTALNSGLIAAVCHGVFPKVAAGERWLVPRSCRVTLCVVLVTAAGAAIVAPFLVPFVFGAPFKDSVPLVEILLVAGIAHSGSVMLGSAFTAAGDPAASLRAQLIGLAITVPALLVFLPSTGARGAAIISLVAYTVQFAVQLAMAQRRFDARWWEFLVPTRADLAWILANTVGRVRRRRGEQV